VPLQGKYSEALPAQARAKSKVSAFPRTQVTPLFFAREGVLFDLLPCPVIVLYSSIYIAPINSHGKQRRFWFNYLQEKRQVLTSDKDVERSEDKKEERAEGGRRFQREGPIMEKDSDMATVVLVQGS